MIPDELNASGHHDWLDKRPTRTLPEQPVLAEGHCLVGSLPSPGRWLPGSAEDPRRWLRLTPSLTAACPLPHFRSFLRVIFRPRKCLVLQSLPLRKYHKRALCCVNRPKPHEPRNRPHPTSPARRRRPGCSTAFLFQPEGCSQVHPPVQPPVELRLLRLPQVPQPGPTPSDKISRFASAASRLRTGPAHIPPAMTGAGGAVCGSGPIHFVTHRGFQPPKMRHKPVGDNSKQPIFSVACRLTAAVVHICVKICRDASQVELRSILTL